MEKKRVFNIPEGGFTVQKTLEFTQLNSSFEAEIYVEKNNKIINAKSILGAMSLLIPSKIGTEFTLIVKGKDAEYTIQKITNFIEKKITTSNLSLWNQEGIENVNTALKESHSRWTLDVQNVAKS
ncbi:phosphotransferase system HPr (HPr) family protein [Neobacillus niacini]|uniref:HPr family phosphocarrier protein n=1 Tax=Neobacillus niacini TaxID=86668 RepID=UPI002781D739|nr:HPr family phosphocarrier protein [Neobacillus niacini]MDQ1005288.1 phosphotransferase system HPr (HPr) family protein [Neobacillus niacini]